MPKVRDFLHHFESLAPRSLAESWDNVGLIAGDSTAAVTGVVVSVNLGPEALSIARKTRANLIICHHPPIFKAISRLTKSNQPYLFEALSLGISVIALHTNFDLCAAKLYSELAQRLGGRKKGSLAERESGVPASLRLDRLAISRDEIGHGFWAEVPVSKEKRFSNLLSSVKKVFQLRLVTVSGPGLNKPNLSVRKFGFSAGQGSGFVKAALEKNLDVYICGEMGYHQMLEARREGLTVMLLGHSYSERFFVETLAEWTRQLKVKSVTKVFEEIHHEM